MTHSALTKSVQQLEQELGVKATVRDGMIRLDGEGWVQRIQRFATDGRMVFFSLADDEADVWVMTLVR